MAKKKNIWQSITSKIGAAFNSEDFEQKFLVYNVRFLLFIGLIAILYIANARYAEKNMRQINTLQKDIKELRWKHTSLKAEHMYSSKQTEIAKRVNKMGLQESIEAPSKIVVPKGSVPKPSR